MLIGTKKRVATDVSKNFDVSVNNDKLELVNKFKYLGVWIDENISWSDHIDAMCKKVSQRLGILKRVRPYINLETSKKLYNALILPLLEFNCVVWSNTTETNLNRVQKLQNRAARIILRCPFRTHVDDMLKVLKWQRCNKRYDYHKSVLMYKCVNRLVPNYLNNIFISNNTLHEHNTRGSKNLFIHGTGNESAKRKFSYQGSLMWNQIPIHIKECATVQSFKRNYKKSFFK